MSSEIPSTYFISVAMAQEIPRPNIDLSISDLKFFLFFAMRDNGDDAFGEPLSRVDRPPHVTLPSPIPTSSTTSSSTGLTSSFPSSMSTTTTPLDLFLQAVHRALDSGLSKETLIANIHLLSDERSSSTQPVGTDEFFSQ